MVKFVYFSGLMLFMLICKFYNNKIRSKIKWNKEEEKKCVFCVYRCFYNVCIEFDMMIFIFIVYLC